jgi:hypothetical protein
MECVKSKYSKQHMKQDPLTSAYLKVINENASNGKVDSSLKEGEPYGDAANKKNVENFYKDSGDAKVAKDIKKPEEAPAELSEDPENEPKELKDGKKLTLKDSLNPFDALYNKIISEDSFSFDSEEGVEPEDNFGGPEGIGMGHESDDEEMGEYDDVEDHVEEEHEDLESLVSQLKELVGKLESHLEGHVEHEEGEEFPEDSREESEEEAEEEDEDLSEEAVEAEVLGHALVDQEKLEAGQTKKSVFTVKGAVPVKSNGKKAAVVAGKKVNGKPEDFENKEGISKLQNKKDAFNVGGVKAGEYLFKQGE